jgi:1-deoxyxylulose-5-phosphate synthase
VADAVRAIAAQREVPSATVALAWLLGKPGVCAPIIGATSERHLEDAVAATRIQLSPEEVATLEQPYLPRLMSDF